MELGKVKNLLQPENARYIPLAVYGLARGLARVALEHISPSIPPNLHERQAASIQFYSTGVEDGEPSADS